MGINDTEKDDLFLQKTKSLLDGAADNLDENTLASLRQARMKALDLAAQQSSDKKRIDSVGRGWMLPAGGFAAVATVAVLTVSIWATQPVDDEFTHALSDIDLLTSSESLEFYEELAFYAWIDEQDAQG